MRAPVRAGLGALLVLALTAGACGSDTKASDDSKSSVTTAASVSGTTFSDPEGDYKITIADSWEAHHDAVSKGIEAWAIAAPQDDFAPNVNVLTQKAGDISMGDYLDVSVENAPKFVDNFKLVHRGTLKNSVGETLGVMEYTGHTSGKDLSFYAVVRLAGGNAVVATFTSPPDRYAELKTSVAPYLATLRG